MSLCTTFLTHHVCNFLLTVDDDSPLLACVDHRSLFYRVIECVHVSLPCSYGVMAPVMKQE